MLEYKTSYEKWDCLTKIARELFVDDEIANTCKELRDYIKEKGDEKLGYTVRVEIDTSIKFKKAIKNSKEMPCPHCEKYAIMWVFYTHCGKCPLQGSSPYLCCVQWDKVYNALYRDEI